MQGQLSWPHPPPLNLGCDQGEPRTPRHRHPDCGQAALLRDERGTLWQLRRSGPATHATEGSRGEKRVSQGGTETAGLTAAGSNSPQASPPLFAPSLPARDVSDQQFSSPGTLTANMGTYWLVESMPEPGKAWHHCGPSNPVTGGLDGVPLWDMTLREADPPGCTRGPIFEPFKVEDQTLGGDQFTKFQKDYTLHAPSHQVLFSGPLSGGGRSNAWTPPTGGSP